MRRSRRISLSTHGFVELAIGLALIASAFVLSFGGAGFLFVLVAGTVVAGLGLSAAETRSLATHRTLDGLVTAMLVLGALGAGVADEAAPATLLLGAAFVQILLPAATRWTRAPLRA